MKKQILALSLVGAMAVSLCACGGGSASKSASESSSSASSSTSKASSSGSSSSSGENSFTPSGETLNVGIQSSVISVPVAYAEAQGYYDEVGLDVNIIVFPNGSPENEGLAAEQLDVASNGLASVYSIASGVCDWIGETDCGTTVAKIYASPDSPVFEHQGEIDGKPDMYGSADTLKGVTVLGPTSTIEQWIAYSYFEQFGLTAGEDYAYTNMDKAAAAQAVISGQGDMFVASDVNFCTMMEEAGFKEVATCYDATGTYFNNGYLARKAVLEEKYDDVVLFLQATFKATEELNADLDLRVDFTKQFYADNAKEVTDEDIKQEAELRPYVGIEDMQADDYVLGQAMVGIGEFFGSIDVIDSDQVENLPAGINAGPIQDAFGITVKSVAD